MQNNMNGNILNSERSQNVDIQENNTQKIFLSLPYLVWLLCTGLIAKFLSHVVGVLKVYYLLSYAGG